MPAVKQDVESYVLKASRSLAESLLRELRAPPGTEVIEEKRMPAVFYEDVEVGVVDNASLSSAVIPRTLRTIKVKPARIAMIMDLEYALVDDRLHVSAIKTSVEPRW